MKGFILRALFLAMLVVVPVVCANQKTVQAPIPGSVNTFDSSTYQSLRVAHDIAKSLSDQAAAGKYHPTPQEKVVINQFIADINVADTVYKAYHAGAATQAQMQTALTKVQTDQATLPVPTGGK